MFRCSNFALSHIRSKTTFIFRSFQRSSHRENDSNRVGVKSEIWLESFYTEKQRQWLHTLGSLIRAAETKMRNRLRGILHQSCCCCCQKEDLQTRTRQRWSFYSLYDSFIFLVGEAVLNLFVQKMRLIFLIHFSFLSKCCLPSLFWNRNASLNS